MEKIKYAALGSIITLNGSFEKVMIIGRGLILKKSDNQNVIFDYSGVTYPEGLTSDQVAYFNHKDIAKIVFEGFRDDADEVVINNINSFLEEHPEIEHGNVEEWGQQE